MKTITESLTNQDVEKNDNPLKKRVLNQILHFFDRITDITKKLKQTHEERTKQKEMEVLYKKLVIKAVDNFLLTHDGPDGSYPL